MDFDCLDGGEDVGLSERGDVGSIPHHRVIVFLRLVFRCFNVSTLNSLRNVYMLLVKRSTVLPRAL